MMYPKRLIEVDLPIARISAHARREKSIRHGHISTLHIWWARRPLAACRAVICASLWPDPADEHCPQAFREAAVEQIKQFASRVFPKRITAEGKLLSSERHLSQESRGRWEAIAAETLTLDANETTDMAILRMCLLDFIADFANWDNSTVQAYLETSRALTQAAHEALGGAPGTRQLVVDPFAGGGSIPLEALRVGADAFASDLNPVAVLLNNVLLESIPKYGQRLADEVRKWGRWVKEKAEQELVEFYPKDPDGATPVAYLWARTILCEGPTCGASIPLLRSLWLSKKNTNRRALKLVAVPDGNTVDVELLADPKPKEVGNGTVARGSVTCPCCGFTTAAKSVRSQFKSGLTEPRLVCVVTTRDEERGRVFRLPIDHDYVAIEKAKEAAIEKASNRIGDLSLVPDEAVNPLPHSVNRPTIYGMNTWGSLFTPRQVIAHTTFLEILAQFQNEHSSELEGEGLGKAVHIILSLALSRLTDICNALCPWSPNMQQVVHLFGRQAIPMTWDFAEASSLSSASGDFATTINNMLKIIERESCLDAGGHAEIASATTHPLPDDSVQCLMTDPPYYDAISYADLSDFFYVWLRRCLHTALPELFRFSEVPKAPEIIVEPTPVVDVGPKDAAYYLENMMKAMCEGRRILAPSGIGVIVFAHKSTDGWEAQLDGMLRAGLVITASWPIDTERADKVSAIGQARLGSSVHLVCRPRENESGELREEIGEWRDVLSELPKRIHEWMPRLAAEGVVGADAIFACLGPALEIFSRYSRVEKASGEAVPLREYLEQVWAAVSTEALSMIFEDADAAGLEPDARLTAMWLWTLGANTGDSKGNGESADDKVTASTGYTLEFDAARKIAQGLGIHLEQSESIVEVKGDKARMLPVSERTRHLFGKDEADARTARGPKKKKTEQQRSLFEELDALESEPDVETVAGELKPQAGETVLDRVHQSMILFASGRGEALRRFLVEDGAGTDARFWKLAQSLSALYPKDTDEKRWVDGVLARKKGLGL